MPFIYWIQSGSECRINLNRATTICIPNNPNVYFSDTVLFGFTNGLITWKGEPFDNRTCLDRSKTRLDGYWIEQVCWSRPLKPTFKKFGISKDSVIRSGSGANPIKIFYTLGPIYKHVLNHENKALTKTFIWHNVTLHPKILVGLCFYSVLKLHFRHFFTSP